MRVEGRWCRCQLAAVAAVVAVAGVVAAVAVVAVIAVAGECKLLWSWGMNNSCIGFDWVCFLPCPPTSVERNLQRKIKSTHFESCLTRYKLPAK